MQKKIIVLAIAAAFAAPAFAETANVNVYGSVNVAVESINVGDDATGTKKGYAVNKVSSNATRLGFKGTKELKNGLSAIWQIEQQIDVDNATAKEDVNGYAASSSFATRNTFAGLSSKTLGSVQVGRFDTPYKVSTRRLDAFGDSLADNRSLMGGTSGKSVALSFDGRPSDTISYTSPEMAGVTVAAAYVAGAENTKATTVNKGFATSLAAMYKAGALYATAAYEVHTFGDLDSGSIAGTTAKPITAGQKETAVKFGVGYKIAELDLSAAVENTSDTLEKTKADTNKYGHNAFYVAAKYSLSSDNTVKLAYTKAGETNNSGTAKNDGASQISVGFDHNMDKSTLLFAHYTIINNDDGASYGLATAGSTGGTAAAGAGSRMSALALGVKHAF